MEEHLEYLFMAERDTTKALILKELQNMKSSGTSKRGIPQMMKQAIANTRAQ